MRAAFYLDATETPKSPCFFFLLSRSIYICELWGGGLEGGWRETREESQSSPNLGACLMSHIKFSLTATTASDNVDPLLPFKSTTTGISLTWGKFMARTWQKIRNQGTMERMKVDNLLSTHTSLVYGNDPCLVTECYWPEGDQTSLKATHLEIMTGKFASQENDHRHFACA